MQLRMNRSTPGMSGEPSPKNPNRNTHANMAISITFLIPNLFIKNGIRSMHSVSESWEIDISALEFLTAKVSAYSGFSPKEPRKVLAYPLVI